MAEKESVKDSVQESQAGFDVPDLKLKPNKDADLSKVIRASWEQSHAARNKWIDDKKEGLAMYWGVRGKKDFPFPNCANLHVPLTRTISDTLHSNLMGSIDTIKPASIMPVGPEDVPKSRKAEKLLNWQFTTQVDYTDLADRMIQSMLTFGPAPIKVRYVVERRDGEKIFDGIKAEVLSVERFLVPPDALDSNVQEMDYVMHEIPMTKSDLKKRKATYKNLGDEDLEKLGDIYSKAETEDQQIETLRTFYSGVDSTSSTLPDKRYATVIEWYGYFDYDGDGIDEHVMATCLKERDFKVLRVVPWKRKRPFVLVNFSDIPGRAFGESVPDLLLRINQELNTIHNQRVDAVTITNIPFFFFDPSAGWTPDKVLLSPGLGIPVNGSPSQAVYFPALNTARPEMYREEDNLFLYAERMLGAGSNVQGIMQTKRTTATEVASVDRRAGIRFLTIFNRVKRGIRDIFKLSLELDREYMPAETQVRITGIDKDAPLFETIKSEDLEGQFDIVINGNSIIDDQAEKQEMMQAYQLGMMNPLVVRNETAVYELTKDLYTKLGVKRIDAYLKKPVDEIPKNPEEEHNLLLQEEYPEPNLGENIEEHLKKHAEMIQSDSFNLLSKRGQMMLMRHYQDTVKMKNQLEQLRIISEMQKVNSALLASQTGGVMPGGIPGVPAGPDGMPPRAGMPEPKGMPMAGGPGAR